MIFPLSRGNMEDYGLENNCLNYLMHAGQMSASLRTPRMRSSTKINGQGISLLSIAGKILAKIILNRIKKIAEEVLPETQCGFRADRFDIHITTATRKKQLTKISPSI